MTQLVSDAFTYSNGALDTASGGVWSIQSLTGGLAVIGNEVREGTSSSLGRFTTTAPPSSDYYSEVTLTTVLANASDEGVGPAVRVLSGAGIMTGYFAQCNSVETKLYQVVSGAFVQVGSNGVACALGDVVRIEVSGTGATVSLVVKRNGTAIITAGDSSAGRITATNAYGIWASHAGGQGQLDNFAGGDLLSASTHVDNSEQSARNRPGRGPYSFGRYFRPRYEQYRVLDGALVGTSSLTFSPVGVLSGAGALPGSAALVFTPAGALTGAGALVGSSTLVFTASAVLQGAGALAGASALIFAASGSLTGAGSLAGTSTLVFGAVGALSGGGALSGSAALTFTPSGVLTGAGALAGSSALVFTPAGVLTGAGALAGSSALVFGATGTLTGLGSGQMIGSTALTFAATGALTGAGALAGSAALAFGSNAILTGAGALFGLTALAFGASGTLANGSSGAAAGTVALIFVPQGTLTGAGALSGLAPLTLGGVGVLIDATAPIFVLGRIGGSRPGNASQIRPRNTSATNRPRNR